MDALLDTIIRFAQEMLAKHGGFLPFAAAVTDTGAVEMVGGYTGEEHPPSQAIIDLLYQGLIKQPVVRSELRAFASTLDCRSATTPTLSRSRLNTRAPNP